MNQLKNLAVLFCAIFIWQTSSAQSTTTTVAIEPAATKNQLKLGAGYVSFGTGDLRGIQAYGQYLYKVSQRLGISMEANISHASALGNSSYDSDSTYSVVTSLSEAPFSSFENHDGGGTQHDPHLIRITHFMLGINMNYYLLNGPHTKVKIATGLAYTYLDRNTIADTRSVFLSDSPALTELQTVVLITPVYERLSDWGWNAQLDYEYHFNNRVFTSVGLSMYNFFDTGDDISSIRFGVGVNF